MDNSESQFWTYVLANPAGRFYIGSTEDLQARLQQHNDPEAESTKYCPKNGPWKNGSVESCNSKFRDELLDRELLLHIDELRYVADRWRMDYNHYCPHSSLDYMAPAAFAAMRLEQGSGSLRLTQDNQSERKILS